MDSRLSVPALTITLSFVLLSSCATKGPAKVLSREGDNDAVVFLPDPALQKGDHLTLLSERCTDKRNRSSCTQTPVGHATVIQRLNDRYAKIRFDQATEIYEGQPVEEHVH